MGDNNKIQIGPLDVIESLSNLSEELSKIRINNIKTDFINNAYKEMNKNGLFNFNQKMPELKNLKLLNGKLSKINPIINKINMGLELGKVWLDKDADLNSKLYNTGKKVSLFAGAFAGGKIGALVGTFLGPGIGTGLGAVVGGVVGFISSLLLGFLAENIYDFCAGQIKKGIDYLAGILGSFRSGGVEFVFPKEIPEFKEKFSFDRIHYFAFEYEDEKNNFNVNEMINLINSKFLENNIKITNLNELFDTILMEIAHGFLYKKVLPSISLNFNKEGLLYSIMNDYYKNTITGNILTFIDYYLKSYVNGGFFREEFIFTWQNEKNTDQNFLQKNIIDFKKYLYEINHNPNDINYISMYDLNNNPKNDNNYISAFRIIGNINNNLKFYKNLLFPNCSYFTQYDFDILPEWQSKIELDLNEKNSSEKIKTNHKIMATRVTFLMKKIPFLKPYFEILKLITFSIHYLPNIQKIGMFPIFSNAIQNKMMGEKYCKSIPKVFPPLPIRKRITIEVVINIK